MNKRGLSRMLSVLLLVVMVVSMLPLSAYAEGTTNTAEDPENHIITDLSELTDGSKVVIYNDSAKGVIGLEDDLGASMSCVATAIEDGTAIVGNGGRVFTVSVSGEDYSYESGGKYLAANEKEELFLSDTLDDNARWNPEKADGGYVMYNKAANSGGSARVCIAYNSGSFSGGTDEGADSASFEMNFCPVADGTTVTQGIVNKPAIVFGALPEAYVGQDYPFTFTVDAVFGLDGTPNAFIMVDAPQQIQVEKDGETYNVTIPAAYLAGRESITVRIECFDTTGVFIEGNAVITILDEPVFSDLRPTAGSQTGEDKRPLISATVFNAGENPTITMTVNGEELTPKYEDGVISYQPETDMADGCTTVTVTVKHADDKEASKSWDFTVGTAEDHGHDYTWTVTTEPTCTEPGLKTGVCACGDTVTEAIPATGHNYTWTVTTEPTCTEPGLKTGVCACGDTVTEAIGATGHSYEWTVKEATCTESGLKTGVCACGDTVTELIEATGHSYEWTVKEATCTESGLKTGVCACGDTVTEEIPATGHTFSAWTVTTPATCTRDGVESRGCVCGTIETRAIEAAGHQFGEWKTVRQPTDYLAGKEERVCSVCGGKETRKIPSLKGVETGDDNHILFWAAALAVSGAGTAVILTRTRKKHKGMH